MNERRVKEELRGELTASLGWLGKTNNELSMLISRGETSASSQRGEKREARSDSCSSQFSPLVTA